MYFIFYFVGNRKFEFVGGMHNEKTNTVYKCLRTARIQDQKVGRKTTLKAGRIL